MAIINIELTIPGDLKDTPIFYHIIKNFDVIPSIKEASFSTEMGWAIVCFKGRKKELERMLEYLKKKGVNINYL
ncbi:MAG: NIL domain-containing protein [Candidatus Omnitrophota bacterium]